jgi:hypothetical protein
MLNFSQGIFFGNILSDNDLLTVTGNTTVL